MIKINIVDTIPQFDEKEEVRQKIIQSKFKNENTKTLFFQAKKTKKQFFSCILHICMIYSVQNTYKGFL